MTTSPAQQKMNTYLARLTDTMLCDALDLASRRAHEDGVKEAMLAAHNEIDRRVAATGREGEFEALFDDNWSGSYADAYREFTRGSATH